VLLRSLRRYRLNFAVANEVDAMIAFENTVNFLAKASPRIPIS
jgi:hypothetical protein